MGMKHLAIPGCSTTVTGIQPGDFQPNAVDVRLNSVTKISSDLFMIDDDKKQHRSGTYLVPDYLGYFDLPVGSYDVAMVNEVSVGEGEAGWVVARSTLNRNGVFLTSGLYDAGYTGTLGAVMHVTSGPMRVKKGTRIAQFLLFDAQTLHKYNGDYGVDPTTGLAKPMEAQLYG